MFEVPRVFGPFETLLLDLGASEKPEIGDYCKFLSELKRDTGENALNPNELLAVLRVIGLIVTNIATTTTESAADRIPSAIPESTTVAGPVFAWSAIPLTML